jgi:hypothetical protein
MTKDAGVTMDSRCGFTRLSFSEGIKVHKGSVSTQNQDIDNVLTVSIWRRFKNTPFITEMRHGVKPTDNSLMTKVNFSFYEHNRQIVTKLFLLIANCRYPLVDCTDLDR